MKFPSSAVACLLTSLAAQVHAQEASNSQVMEAESQFLFINMLEFLGEFETQQGEWISPDIIANEAFSDLDGAGAQNAGNGEQRVLSATPEDNE